MEEKLLSESSGKRLTLSQLKMLSLLAHTEARTVGEVAAFLNVSNAAASKAVDKLVRRRLLRRTEGLCDRRASVLSLSETGRKLVTEYEAFRHRKLSKVFEEIPADDLRRTAELLDRLSARIVTQTANPEEICLQCGIHLQKRCLVREAARMDCSFLKRRNQSKARSHVSNHPRSGTKDEVPAGSRPAVGPQGE